MTHTAGTFSVRDVEIMRALEGCDEISEREIVLQFADLFPADEVAICVNRLISLRVIRCRNGARHRALALTRSGRYALAFLSKEARRA